MTFSAKHIYLRPLKRSDALAIHLYASDEAVTKYLLWGPNTYEETLKYLDASLSLPLNVPRNIFRFAIILKHTDDLIGMIDLTLKSDRVAELGYILNRSYWGKGYMTEATKLIVTYGFKTLGLSKIIATCDNRNIASYRVMEKCGFHLVSTYKRFNTKNNCEMTGLLYELANI